MTEEQAALDALAEQMFDETAEDGQSARRVVEDAEAQRLRTLLRDLGRARGVRLRTARIDQTVAVARLDAAVWQDDQATMRAKLTPKD
jgi:hypothetical protein